MTGPNSRWYSKNMLLLHMLFCYWRPVASSLETTERPLHYLTGNSQMKAVPLHYLTGNSQMKVLPAEERIKEEYLPKWYGGSKILMNTEELQNPLFEIRRGVFHRSNRATRLMPIDITILNTGSPAASTRGTNRRIMGVDISSLSLPPDLNLPISKSPFPDIDEPINENYVLDEQREQPYNRWHFTKSSKLKHWNLSSNNETNEIIIFPILSFPFKETASSVINKKSMDSDDLQTIKSHKRSAVHYPYQQQNPEQLMPEILANLGTWIPDVVPPIRKHALSGKKRSQPHAATPNLYNVYGEKKPKLVAPKIYMVLPRDLEHHQQFKERQKRNIRPTKANGINLHQYKKIHPMQMRKRSFVSSTNM